MGRCHGARRALWIQTGPLAFGQLKRNVGLAGATIRPWQKLSLNVDYEGASTDRRLISAPACTTTTRCGRGRAIRPSTSLCFQANFRFLDNQNPTAGVQYDLRSRDNSLAVFWTPNGGKRVSVMAEYDRYTLYSSIDYLLLPFFTPTVSDLPGQRAHGDLERRHRAAGDRGGSRAQADRRRIAVHLRGFAVHAVLPAAGTPVACPSARTYNGTPSGDGTASANRSTCMKAFRTHTFMTGLRVSK